MITEIFRPVKNLIDRFEVLVNQRANEHANWKSKINEISYKSKSSIVENHTINKFYSLPNTWYLDSSEYPNLPPTELKNIPSGIYRDYHGEIGGYGNFCVKNSLFYLTVGQKIFKFDPTTEEITTYNNRGIRKYLWKLQWSDFPPKTGTTLQYWRVSGSGMWGIPPRGANTDFSSIQPLQNGKWALLSWSGAGGETVVCGMENRKRVMYILNSDFTLSSQFDLGGEFANNLIDWATLGNQIVLLTLRKITSSGGNINENVFTFFNTSGFYQGEFIIKPALYTYIPKIEYGGFFSGILSYECYTLVFGYDIPGTYEEFLRDKPPDVEIIGHGFLENGYEAVSCRRLKNDPITGNKFYYQGITLGGMTTNQEYIFIYDKNDFLIRVFDNHGILKRIISLQEFEYFGDKGIKPTYYPLDVQISIDPTNTKYLYIYLPVFPQTIGRCKIDD